MKRKPESFLPLTQSIAYILLALLRDAKHGYLILQEVNKEIGSSTGIGPTSLYRALKELCDAELIWEVPAPADSPLDDHKRRYYTITPLGVLVIKAERERMLSMIKSMNSKVPLG